MVRCEINNGAAVLDIEYEDGMTVSDLQQKISDHDAGRHYRFNSFEVYDPSQNAHLSQVSEIVDDRLYFVSCWVQTTVDDKGDPIHG